MTYMKSSYITSEVSGEYRTGETEGKSRIFPESQFFPAKDGTWLMVDWVAIASGSYWYVTEGV